MNSYELSRAWFDYSFENPDKVKPIHTAVYFFAIEHCNRLGWKEKFGFPTTMVMEAIGVKSYNTYIKALNELVEFGFIKMIQVSKNQHSANIVAISKNVKADNKALDKALIKHGTKQDESTEQSTVSIDKQYNNKTIKQDNNNTPTAFSFRKSFLELGVDNDILNDWLAVRKKKKAVNSKTAFNLFVNEVEKSKITISQAVEKCAGSSWASYKVEYDKDNAVVQGSSVINPRGKVKNRFNE